MGRYILVQSNENTPSNVCDDCNLFGICKCNDETLLSETNQTNDELENLTIECMYSDDTIIKYIEE